MTAADDQLATYRAAKQAARTFIQKYPLESDTPSGDERVFMHAMLDLLKSVGVQPPVMDTIIEDWVQAKTSVQMLGWERGFRRGYERGKETVQPPF